MPGFTSQDRDVPASPGISDAWKGQRAEGGPNSPGGRGPYFHPEEESEPNCQIRQDDRPIRVDKLNNRDSTGSLNGTEREIGMIIFKAVRGLEMRKPTHSNDIECEEL